LPGKGLPVVHVVAEANRVGHFFRCLQKSTENLLSVISRDGVDGWRREVASRGNAGIVVDQSRVVGVANRVGELHCESVVTGRGLVFSAAIVVKIAPLSALG